MSVLVRVVQVVRVVRGAAHGAAVRTAGLGLLIDSLSLEERTFYKLDSKLKM